MWQNNIGIIQKRNECDTADNQSTQTVNHRYWVTDVCRLSCACLVVLIHSLEVKEGHHFAHMIVTCFAQQAVPFFFIVSGFFFANKLSLVSNKNKTISQYVGKQVLRYCVWVLLELPGVICSYLSLYPNASFLYIAAVIFRRIVLCGQGVYWYILILAESCLFAGICIKKSKESVLYVIGGIGLVLGYIYDAEIPGTFSGILHKIVYTIFSWSNNAIMKGIPYVAVGVFIFNHVKSKVIRRTYLAMIYILVSIFSVIVFVYYYNNNYIIKHLFFYPLLATVLFLFSIQPTDKILNNRIASHFRNLSSTIYFTHTIFIYRILDVFGEVDGPVLYRYSMALLMPIGVYIITQCTQWKPLKWLLAIT